MEDFTLCTRTDGRFSLLWNRTQNRCLRQLPALHLFVASSSDVKQSKHLLGIVGRKRKKTNVNRCTHTHTHTHTHTRTHTHTHTLILSRLPLCSCLCLYDATLNMVRTSFLETNTRRQTAFVRREDKTCLGRCRGLEGVRRGGVAAWWRGGRPTFDSPHSRWTE